MSTLWVRNLVGLNFLALADVVIDIHQERQLTGSRVTIPLYQQVVKFHDLMPASSSGMIDRACELRWKAVKLLESRGAISDVTSDAAAHLWDTTVSLTVKPPFQGVLRAVDQEARQRAASPPNNGAATAGNADAAPTERELISLLPPQKVTLPWLIKHVSVQLWISAGVFLLATFMLGVRAAEFHFFRQIAGLKTGGEAPAPKLLQRPVSNNLVLPRASRIVLHVRVGDSLVTPEEVKNWLVVRGYAVPAIRRVDVNNSPSVASEVRFFHESDRRGAESLVQALRDWGYPHVDRRYAPGFERRVPRSQYEVWFVQP